MTKQQHNPLAFPYTDTPPPKKRPFSFTNLILTYLIILFLTAFWAFVIRVIISVFAAATKT